MATVSIEDRVAIADAIHSFFHLIDSGRAAQTANMFAADACLTFGEGSPQPGTIVGVAISKAMIARQAQVAAFTRHIVANIRFEPCSDSVGADYLLTLYRSDDGTRNSVPAFIADVADVWERDGAEWLIRERTITPTFTRL